MHISPFLPSINLSIPPQPPPQVSHLKTALGSAHALLRHLRLSSSCSNEADEEGEEEGEEGAAGTYELSVLSLRNCLQYDAAAARYVCHMHVGTCVLLESSQSGWTRLSARSCHIH